MKDIKELVEQCYKNLPERIRDWLKQRRGLNDEIIDRFRLGWDGKALTIPIYNADNQYIFFKFRKDPQDNSDLSKYWYSPNSSAELYGWEHIINPKPSIILCEGELDRLILEAHNLPAITTTSGAGSFKDEWAKIINALPSQLFICFDNDEAGMNGSGRIAELMPKAKIVRIPKVDRIKDVTDLITTKGIEEFKKLLDEAKTLSEIEAENKVFERAIRKSVFSPLSSEELLEVLGLTIKQDKENKLITFLCQLSAYTENSQFNISFNAPSSTGKSYLPLEIASLFPPEDVKAIGYCSPTAFFHDVSVYDKEQKTLIADLSRQILIFLDQPHTLLLQHLRPLLSHDKKEISIKITDKTKGIGLRTKNIIIRGFPAVIFCSAGLRLDEQETTRFLLLSPEVNQEKIRQAIYEKLLKETNYEAYKLALENNPQRQALKERIKAIKEEQISEIKIGSPERIQEAFLEKTRVLKPRHSRDIGRLISLVKALALLNLWQRERDGLSIIANDEDIRQALELWDGISQAQEFNLPPYIYNLYLEVISPAFVNNSGLTRKDIIHKYYEIYERPLPNWQLSKEILPMLEMAGLIIQEPDPEDKRKMLIYPMEIKNKVDSTVYTSKQEPNLENTPSSLL